MSKTDKLKREYITLQKKLSRLRAQLSRTDNERWLLEKKIRREILISSIGQQVKRRTRSSFDAELNDAIGKLIEVRRTRCTIDYSDIGRWDLPIEDVILADQNQGYTIEFLSSGEAA